MNYNWSPEQLAILIERDNAAIIRDLRHTPGWEVYKQLANSRIQQMTNRYLRDSLPQDEAWNERLRLQAVMDFQMKLEEIVDAAVELIDPATREEILYSFQQGFDM